MDGGAAAPSGSETQIGALHRAVLDAAMPAGETGVRRWGWTESERLDAAAVDAARHAVEGYVAARRDAASGAWGFAEPRAALLLDLWAQVSPEAIFILPYRAPWDVVCEVLQAGLPELRDHPDYAARAWLRYTRAVCAFARRHRSRCIVVHGDAIGASPGAFAAALAAIGGASLPMIDEPQVVARAAAAAAGRPLARLDHDGPLAGLVRATAHEVPTAYDELQRLADLPAAPAPTQRAGVEALAIGRLATWLIDGAPAAAGSDRAQPRAAVAAPRDPAERWFREHYGEAADKTLAFLADGDVSLEGRDVADIGSGDGIIDLALVHRGRPRRLVGYDLRRTNREHLLAQADRYGVASRLPDELEFESSQTTAIPAADDAFDVVVSWSAFEHISDPVGVAREIRRILRPGGTLFLQLWPFYHSSRGSHLWDWFPQPHHHLLEHEDVIVERMLAGEVHEPTFTSYMADEFRRLNRVTLEELHRSLLAAGLHVARLELMADLVQIPRSLARYPLADLAVGGVQLLAV